MPNSSISSPRSSGARSTGLGTDAEHILREKTARRLSGILEDAATHGPALSDPQLWLKDSELVNRLLDDFPRASRDGHAAVVMAGPPGAGKSTLLRRTLRLEDYVVIDPDRVKEMILDDAKNTARIQGLLEITLPDGGPVRLHELGALVHAQSVRIAKIARDRCLDDHINVVIEGTLRWRGLPAELALSLDQAQYARLDILAVNVPQSTAVEQAMARWWRGRYGPDASDNGARYTPLDAIASCYSPEDNTNTCVSNARDLYEQPEFDNFDETSLVVFNPAVNSSPTILRRGRKLGTSTSSPAPLSGDSQAGMI